MKKACGITDKKYVNPSFLPLKLKTLYESCIVWKWFLKWRSETICHFVCPTRKIWSEIVTHFEEGKGDWSITHSIYTTALDRNVVYLHKLTWESWTQFLLQRRKHIFEIIEKKRAKSWKKMVGIFFSLSLKKKILISMRKKNFNIRQKKKLFLSILFSRFHL